MPLFHNNHDELRKLVSPKQRIMYFQYRYFNKNAIFRAKPHVVLHSTDDKNVSGPVNMKPAPVLTREPSPPHPARRPLHETVFTVSPDIQNDIYHLHDNNNEYIGVAYIPDYTTSVMMNKLFRKIKENDNLDALEESDDEDEFESEDVDKFVHLDTKHSMSCTYNRRFKMWVPIKLCDRIK